jgi:hypothetical protein
MLKKILPGKLFCLQLNPNRMSKRSLLFVLIASLFLPVPSMAQDDFGATVKKLQGALTTVATGSKTYDQKLTPNQFGSVRYEVEEMDQKGGKTSYAYEFNMADIDPYAVRQETQKDIILVSLTVRNKQKLIKVSRNGEVQSYDDQVKIRAKDIDNARALTDLIKQGIPPAEKLLAAKLKLNTYEEMVSWLTANTKSVELGSSKSIKQTLAKGDYVGSLKLTEIEIDAKGSVEEQYTFNLADINLNTVNFKVNGNKFGLNFEVLRNLKAISVLKSGKNSFVSELTINTNNVDEARDIKTVLAKVVPLAVDKVKSDNPKAGTTDEIGKALKAVIKDVKSGEKLMTQVAEPQCTTTIMQTTLTKDGSEKHVYTFNWMDLNPNVTKVDVTSDKMYVQAITLDKGPMIMHFKNDKLDGYENEVKLYAENMEIARRLKFVAEKAAEKCKTSYKDPFAPNVNEAYNWLKKSIGEVKVEENSIKQTFEAAASGNLNKIKYTSIMVKGNTSSEEILEFNFSDINPTTIELQTKGKLLYVKFESNFKAKIFGAYKDGKIQPYTTSGDIAVKDIETARGVIAAMRKCVDGFKTK